MSQEISRCPRCGSPLAIPGAPCTQCATPAPARPRVVLDLPAEEPRRALGYLFFAIVTTIALFTGTLRDLSVGWASETGGSNPCSCVAAGAYLQKTESCSRCGGTGRIASTSTPPVQGLLLFYAAYGAAIMLILNMALSWMTGIGPPFISSCSNPSKAQVAHRLALFGLGLAATEIGIILALCALYAAWTLRRENPSDDYLARITKTLSTHALLMAVLGIFSYFALRGQIPLPAAPLTLAARIVIVTSFLVSIPLASSYLYARFAREVNPPELP